MSAHLRKLLIILNRRDKQWLLILLFAMLFSSILEVVSIGSVPLLITLVADPAMLQSFPFVGGWFGLIADLPRRHLILWGGLVFLLLFLVRTVVLVATRYAQFRFAASRQVRLSTELFSRYLRAPYLYHLKHNSSELIRNIQVGAMRIGGQVISQLLSGIQNLLLLGSILLLLLFAKPLVTVMSFSIFGVFGAIFVGLTKKRTRALGQLEMQERKASLQTLRQSLSGIREIQLLGKPSFFIYDFRRRMQKVAVAQRDKQLLAYISGPMLEMLAIFTLIALTFALLAFGNGMTETIALLGLYAVAFVRMKNGLTAVLGIYTNLTYSLVSVDPVFEGLKELAAQPVGDIKQKSLSLQHNIELQNISFSYPDAHKKILKDVSLMVPKGSYIGLVGTTGAGKSTLINVLLGILPPNRGSVIVDGCDIHDDLRGWQQCVGYVPQDLFLLDDSIRRNVALGTRDEEIDDEQIRDVLRKAQMLEFVESLPEGFSTMVGERGVRLSGGQKQRISIARALYRQPELLVLDEATSALDTTTEKEFLESIRQLRNELTIVSVAHRASTLEDCGMIYKIEMGRISELSRASTGNWVTVS